MKKKYAVKINLSVDDWIYVTQDSGIGGGNCWDLDPVLFESENDAESYAEIWRKKYNGGRYVQVVQYEAENYV